MSLVIFNVSTLANHLQSITGVSTRLIKTQALGCL